MIYWISQYLFWVSDSGYRHGFLMERFYCTGTLSNVRPVFIITLGIPYGIYLFIIMKEILIVLNLENVKTLTQGKTNVTHFT